MNVGNVIATAVQLAVIATVALLSDLKFRKYCAVTFVEPFDQAVVTLVLAVPYLAILVFKLVAVHPANVWVLLTAPPILAPVPFTEPDTVTLLVGLLIVNIASYVPLVGPLHAPPLHE